MVTSLDKTSPFLLKSSFATFHLEQNFLTSIALNEDVFDGDPLFSSRNIFVVILAIGI